MPPHVPTEPYTSSELDGADGERHRGFPMSRMEKSSDIAWSRRLLPLLASMHGSQRVFSWAASESRRGNESAAETLRRRSTHSFLPWDTKSARPDVA